MDLHLKEFLTDEMKTQNQQIKPKLTTMVAKNELAETAWMGLGTSISKRCDIFLFAVYLMRGQIEDIKTTPGVYAVIPNQPASDSSFPKASEEQQPIEPVSVPGAPKSKAPLEKRDKIVEDINAWMDLKFISTPENLKLSPSYAYHEAAGDGVTAILIDSGVNALHNEFSGNDPIIEGYIYGLDAWALPQDYTDRGTCRATKVAGPRYGVAIENEIIDRESCSACRLNHRRVSAGSRLSR